VKEKPTVVSPFFGTFTSDSIPATKKDANEFFLFTVRISPVVFLLVELRPSADHRHLWTSDQLVAETCS
jgi:hypothetical protein